MGEHVSSALPNLGIAFGEKLTRIVNGTGGLRLRGEVLQFDLRLTVATNHKIGDPNSSFVVCVMPAAADDGHGLYCLLAEDIPAGGQGEAYLWGEAPMGRYTPTQEPTIFGQPIGPDGATSLLDGVGFAGAAKALGFSIDSLLNLPAGALMRVHFNGIYGIGKG